MSNTFMHHNIGTHLTQRATISADKVAFVEFERQQLFTFKALNENCNRIANALLAYGIQPGERVCTLLKNEIEFIEILFACAKIGAVLVPINWRLTASEIDFILQNCEPALFVFDADFDNTIIEIHKLISITHYLRINNIGSTAESFAENYAAVAARNPISEPPLASGGDALLFIMYTSGTTGHPKGVMCSHNNLLWAEICNLASSDMRYEDIFLLAMPMFHIGSMLPATQLVHRGATGVIMRDIDMDNYFKAIEQERVSITMAVPALLQFLLYAPQREQYDLSSLRWIVAGAAPVPVALIKAYGELGIEINQAYGLTEATGPGALLMPEDAERKVGSCGRPVMHVAAKIVDSNGEEVANDGASIGELILGGKSIMQGYWKNPEATAETLQNGWLYTGDLCTIDEDGFITICDRKKDMIISGGENIYPAELENILAGCPQVKEAAVIGIASVKWGESPMAIIVATESSTNEEHIIDFCRRNMAGYKQPKIFRFTESLPRNASGKLLKKLLREQYKHEQAPE